MRKKIVNLLFIIAIIFSLVPFSSVYATSTATLAVVGEGDITEGIYVGGATDWTTLNTNDCTTGWRTNYGAMNTHFWEFTDFTTAVSSINSVTLYWKTDIYGGFFNSYVLIGGTAYPGSHTTTACANTDHHTWITNPVTGNPWQVSELNGASKAQFGFKANPYVANTDVFYAYVVVDYNPASLPSVTATAPVTYTDTTATLSGTIIDDGGATITNYGFVWDTSDKGDPGNSAPADGIGGWTKGWAVGAGTYAEATYTHAITSLTKNTTYYIRYTALNSVGWEYSDVVSFKTIADPTITTVAASDVGKTTAILNANLTSDGKVGGGEDCTVTFIYKAGSYADYAAILAAGGTETAAAGTWNTGEFPALSIASLTASTQYSFAVKVVNVTTTAAYGARLLFTTTSGVGIPSNLVAIPSSTTCALSWTRGTGAPTTLVKYKTGAYPLTSSEGTTAYLGTSNSVSITGLTIGTTYYVSAWGVDAGVYSVSYTTVMFTTLASGTTTPVPSTPPSYSPFNQTPSDSKILTWPIIGTMLQTNSAAYDTPINWMAYLGCIMFAVIVGIATYANAGNNSVLAAGAALIVLGIGAVAFELMMLWIVVFLLIIYCGFTLFGERR